MSNLTFFQELTSSLASLFFKEKSPIHQYLGNLAVNGVVRSPELQTNIVELVTVLVEAVAKCDKTKDGKYTKVVICLSKLPVILNLTDTSKNLTKFLSSTKEEQEDSGVSIRVVKDKIEIKYLNN